MVDGYLNGMLYAVISTADPLAYPPEPYLCVYTLDGPRFLYAPDYTNEGDGPHTITPILAENALSQGFELTRSDILSLWTQRNHALIDILRTHGILPQEPGPIHDAETTIRNATPAGRITNTLNHHPHYPNSTAHITTNQNGTFKNLTLTLRTTNPYQARSLLLMLGADPDDTKQTTGIDN